MDIDYDKLLEDLKTVSLPPFDRPMEFSTGKESFSISLEVAIPCDWNSQFGIRLEQLIKDNDKRCEAVKVINDLLGDDDKNYYLGLWLNDD